MTRARPCRQGSYEGSAFEIIADLKLQKNLKYDACRRRCPWCSLRTRRRRSGWTCGGQRGAPRTRATAAARSASRCGTARSSCCSRKVHCVCEAGHSVSWSAGSQHGVQLAQYDFVLSVRIVPVLPGRGERPVISTLNFPFNACQQLPSVLHSQVQRFVVKACGCAHRIRSPSILALTAI